MNHTRITIAGLAAVLLLASCQKQYNCTCTFDPDKIGPASYQAFFSIKAKTHEQAVTKCNWNDSPAIGRDCSVK